MTQPCASPQAHRIPTRRQPGNPPWTSSGWWSCSWSYLLSRGIQNPTGRPTPIWSPSRKPIGNLTRNLIENPTRRRRKTRIQMQMPIETRMPLGSLKQNPTPCRPVPIPPPRLARVREHMLKVIAVPSRAVPVDPKPTYQPTRQGFHQRVATQFPVAAAPRR